ncbi:Zinc-containing alcohol dehydrogenase [Sphingobium sp. MI1205]|nr:Zinc-containing alcohol dehydrogenase [Sphingobium sp. MI1205]
MATKAYGAYTADTPVEPITIERQPIGPHDVQIAIAYCRICHSNLHHVRSEWAGTLYPCVAGHVIVGHVTAVGEQVANFRPGDTLGGGRMVDSCQHCAACEEGLEQYCESGFVGTYRTHRPTLARSSLDGDRSRDP